MQPSSVIRDLGRRCTLLPFHRAWLRRAYADDIKVAALSTPRGNAKTWLIGQLAAQALTPGSPTFEPGREVIGVSASMEQSRVMLSFARAALKDREHEYRWLDSGQRLAVTHTATQTKFRILSSSGKRAMGLEAFSTIYADEPAAWESRNGAVMWDAIRTALGKRPGQRLLLIGTRAPAEAGSWWPELLEAGSGPGVHVEVLAAPDEDAWDAWATIRHCNPMARVNAELRKVLLLERDQARRNSTLAPSFQAYRLNRLVGVSKSLLLPLVDWKRVLEREPPEREGQPILGLDLGGERAWSGAAALWPNGRMECFAMLPGVPDIAERERMDAVPRGSYQRLFDAGVMVVDEGRRRARPELLIDHLDAQGIRPINTVCDRFLINTLRDAAAGRWRISPRRTRWSEATEDIAAFRDISLDGDPRLSITPESRALASFSLSQAEVATDDQGSTRLVKTRDHRSRDDVAMAAVLAAGETVRRQSSGGEFYMSAA